MRSLPHDLTGVSGMSIDAIPGRSDNPRSLDIAMLRPNRILGNRYQIVRQIGEGGMGAVYLAKDNRLANFVALKQTRYTDAHMLRAFEREARLLAQLRHQSLPKVIDYFDDSGAQFLVMEYMTGRDLGEMIAERGQPFKLRPVMYWADQLLDVLQYLHSRELPILHRDIKPSNLKLGSGNQIVLLDFGLAKGTVGDLTSVATSRSLLGYTPHFAPLEQIQGTGTDPRSDLYALGATLYYLLTGLTPTDAVTRATAIIGDMPDPLDPPTPLPNDGTNSQLAKDISNLIMRAMALNPKKRPSSATEMREDLRSIRAAHADGVQLAEQVGHQQLPPTVRGSAEKLIPTLKTPANMLPGPLPQIHNRPVNGSRATMHEKSLPSARPLLANRFVVGVLGAIVLTLVLLIANSSRLSGFLANLKSRSVTTGTPALSIKPSVHDFNIDKTIMVRDHPEQYDLFGKSVIINDCIVASLAFSPDGKSLASGTWCGLGITLWNVQTGKIERKITNAGDWSSIAFSPDGNILAAADTGSHVGLWNVQTGTLMKTITMPDNAQPSSVSFSPDGSQLGVGAGKKAAFVFSVSSGAVQHKFDCNFEVISVAFSPDGKFLAAGSNGAYGVTLWDLQTGSVRQNLHHGGALTFSPDGQTLATGSGNDIKLWDWNTGALKNTFTSRGSYLHSITFSPDGRTIAAGGGLWEVLLWDVTSGTLRQKLIGHKDWIKVVAFSQNGDVLVSGSGDGTIKLWK
jgi:serine/threonine protein kinase/sugar lactone lactonase YvrE